MRSTVLGYSLANKPWPGVLQAVHDASAADGAELFEAKHSDFAQLALYTQSEDFGPDDQSMRPQHAQDIRWQHIYRHVADSAVGRVLAFHTQVLAFQTRVSAGKSVPHGIRCKGL